VNFSGLSLEQAPPIEVPFFFFFLALIVATLGGVSFLIFENFSLSLHFFTAGFLTFSVVGALSQMLPVIGGVVFYRPILFFGSFLFLWLITATFLFKFFNGYGFSILEAIFIFFSALFLFGTIFFRTIFKKEATILAISLSSIFYLIGITFILAFIFSGNINFFYSHIILMLYGWIFILIMGVFFRVIPMFWVTTEYPNFCKNFMLPFSAFGLILALINLNFQLFPIWIDFVILSIPLLSFSAVSLKKIFIRKRKIFDITIYYFLFAIFSLIGAIFAVVYSIISKDLNGIFIAIKFFIFGFAINIIIGMIFKIIPFLAWFHLISIGKFNIPPISSFVSKNLSKTLFFIYILIFPFLFFKKKIFFFGTIIYFFLLLVVFFKVYIDFKKLLK